MKLDQFRQLIKEALAERLNMLNEEEEKKEKEESSKKNSGKYKDLKAELLALKKMKKELELSKAAEVAKHYATTEHEYHDLAKIAGELNKYGEHSAKIEEKIDTRIEELEDKLKIETKKIKEMIGLEEDEVVPSKNDGDELQGPQDENLKESFKSLEKKLEKGGKSKKAADKIAGAIAAKKLAGAGKGPTAKQKTRMSEVTGADKERGDKGLKRTRITAKAKDVNSDNIYTYVVKTDYRIGNKITIEEFDQQGIIEDANPINKLEQQNKGNAKIAVKIPGHDEYIKITVRVLKPWEREKAEVK